MRRFRAVPVTAAASLLLTALCAGTAPAAVPPGRADVDVATAERLDAAITAAMEKAAWAAGAITSTLDDLHTWVPALTEGRLPDGGRLLEPDTQAQRMRALPTGYPGVGYGLGIADVNGWVGHNGELPGYETVAARLPQDDAVLVVIVNSDVDKDTGSLSTLIGRTVTEIATPDHLWSLPAAAQPNSTPDATTPPATGTPRPSGHP